MDGDDVVSFLRRPRESFVLVRRDIETEDVLRIDLYGDYMSL